MDAIPEEFREVAAALFSEHSPSEVAANFAEALGIRREYDKLLSITDVEGVHTYLIHFRNNFELLIQKTWADKDNEPLKERLEDKIPLFIQQIERCDYDQAVKNFNVILEELAYLFFGTQSRKDDFTEYTFRIDLQMGLFWWYGRKLASFQHTDNAYLRSLLLLGIGFLTSF